jgi:hypothetical protein
MTWEGSLFTVNNSVTQGPFLKANTRQDGKKSCFFMEPEYKYRVLKNRTLDPVKSTAFIFRC